MSIKEGFIVKEGESVQSWRKRWLVLSAESLAYFTAENKRLRKGSFKLDHVHSVDVLSQYKGKSYVFAVKCPTRTYYIQANDEEDRIDWINSINTAINKPTLGPPAPTYVPQGPPPDSDTLPEISTTQDTTNSEDN